MNGENETGLFDLHGFFVALGAVMEQEHPAWKCWTYMVRSAAYFIQDCETGFAPRDLRGLFQKLDDEVNRARRDAFLGVPDAPSGAAVEVFASAAGDLEGRYWEYVESGGRVLMVSGAR